MADLSSIPDDVLSPQGFPDDLSSIPDEVLVGTGAVPAFSEASPTLEGTASSAGGLGSVARTVGRSAVGLLESALPRELIRTRGIGGFAEQAVPRTYEEDMAATVGKARFASSVPEERAEMYRRQGYKARYLPDLNQVQVFDDKQGGWLAEGTFFGNPLSYGSVAANLEMALPVGLAASGVGMLPAIGSGLVMGTGLGVTREKARAELLKQPLGETVSVPNIVTDALSMAASQPLSKTAVAVARAGGEMIDKASGFVRGLLNKAPAAKQAAEEAASKVGEMATKLGLDPSDFIPSQSGRFTTLKDSARFLAEEMRVSSAPERIDLQEAMQGFAIMNPDVADDLATTPALQARADILANALEDRVKRLNSFYDANNFTTRSGEVFNENFIDALTTNLNKVTQAEVPAVVKNFDEFTRGYIKQLVQSQHGGDEVLYMKQMLEIVRNAEIPSRAARQKRSMVLGAPQTGPITPTRMRELDIPDEAFESKIAFDRWVDSRLAKVDSTKLLNAVQDIPVPLKLMVNMRQGLDDLASWAAEEPGARGVALLRNASNYVRDSIRAQVQGQLPDQYNEFAKLNEDVHNLIPLANTIGRVAKERLGISTKLADLVPGVINTWWRVPVLTQEKLAKNPAAMAAARGLKDKIKSVLPTVDATPAIERARALGYNAVEAASIANASIQHEISKDVFQRQLLFPDAEREPEFEVFPRQMSRVTPKYVDALAEKLLTKEQDEQRKALAAGPLDDLFKAMDKGDDEGKRTSLEILANEFPEVFEDGVGFGGRISSQKARAVYLDTLKKQAIEGSEADRLLYYRQMSSFNKGDYRVLSTPTLSSAKPKKGTETSKGRTTRREYSY